MPKLSVIVPIYNVENYLPACLDSILGQTYSDFELILIDDGSTDHSGCICDEYKELDSRILVIHKTNAGVALARNAGLEVANGDYLGFVDSDDTISPIMFEKMIAQIEKTDSEMVTCQFEVYYSPLCESSKTEQIRSTIEIFEKLLTENLYGFFVWNKIFKMELINQTRFNDHKLYEDVMFVTELIPLISKADFINQPFYHYTQRPQSIIGGAFTPHKMDLIEANHALLRLCQERFPSLTHFAEHRLLLSAFGLLNRILFQKAKIQYKAQYQQLLNIIYQYKAQYRHIPLVKRIALRFLIFFPTFYSQILKCYLCLKSLNPIKKLS